MSKFLIGLFVFSISISLAQTLSPSVVGTSGGSFSSTSGSLNWTLGEVMSETYKTSSKVFTQGFHQPLETPEPTSSGITIYPTPAIDFLYVNTPKTGNYHIEIFDLHGKKLIDGTSTATTPDYVHTLDMRKISSALYLLSIQNLTTGKKQMFKILKD